jgi:hypothetical protein
MDPSSLSFGSPSLPQYDLCEGFLRPGLVEPQMQMYLDAQKRIEAQSGQKMQPPSAIGPRFVLANMMGLTNDGTPVDSAYLDVVRHMSPEQAAHASELHREREVRMRQDSHDPNAHFKAFLETHRLF